MNKLKNMIITKIQKTKLNIEVRICDLAVALNQFN